MPRQTADDEDFDPYHKWLGIPKDQRPPTHYQLLGISPNEEDNEAIEAAAERQKLFIQGFQKGPRSRTASSILYQIEEAKVTLLNPIMRDAYDQRFGIRRDYRRTFAGKSPGASDFGSGSNSVGESGGFLRDYAVYVGIFTTAFLVMAVASFYLPWGKLTGEANEVAAKPIPSPKMDSPKPVVIVQPPVNAPVKSDVIKQDLPDPPKDDLGQWVDVIKNADISRWRTRGIWSKQGGEISGRPANNFASLEIPFSLTSDYELEFEFTRNDRNEVKYPASLLSIPVGPSRARIGFWHDWVELSDLSNPVNPAHSGKGFVGRYIQDERKYGFGKHEDGSAIWIPSGRRIPAKVAVGVDKNEAEIRVYLSNKLCLHWNGPVQFLSESHESDFWDKTERTGIVVGSVANCDITFNVIRVRGEGADKLDGSNKPQPMSPLTQKIRNTKWINSNKVSFEWTSDGRLLHNGKERTWKVLDERRGQLIFSPDHVDTLIFNNTFTEFKQLIKGGPDSHQGRRLGGGL